jgi:signal transduction histidine kinase
VVESNLSATILNVNDDEATRYLSTRTLRMAGYQVLEAATGEEALRLAERERPDVVVLDVKLPDISGYEVCKRLRARPETASIAVMHTSATYVTADKKVRGLEGGADAYLTEPFEGEELIATVRSLLRMRRAEQELRRRAEQLTEADRRKDQFLAMLAHELRNPLAAITTAVGLLERRRVATDPQDVRMVSIIRRQTNHLARLVDDLLDVSRMTRGKVSLRRMRLDLRGVLEQVLTVFRPVAEGRKLTLEASLPAGPLWMEADTTRLEQVFTNLLDNATKYTDAGGISVRAELRARDGRAGAVVRVKDTGIGIRAEVLPTVFDLFSQADESLERTRGGLGIGLTLVRTLVELHEGRVEVHSEGPGQGSEFVVWLPVLPEASDVEQAVVLPGLVKRRRHILLMDDNSDARQELRTLLEAWGHQVEVAADVLRGLELAAQRAPELALVDLGLPGMEEGTRVAEELRARLGRGIRLVALTGQETREQGQARAAGFDEHLPKPVRPDDLNRLLSRL